jgi:Asp-tRNA(Asn)/Glu-tRNA(Gln) amidotransferase B subunit
MKITQQQCQTDMIATDARLRGVKVLSYNQMILEKQQDLATLSDLIRKHGIMDTKAKKDLEAQIQQMGSQINEWLREVGFKDMTKDYAVTVLIEEIKT